MSSQRGYSVFPTTFLTFSLLLLVLAAGFAVGRLVVGRAYLKTAGQFDKLPVPKAQAGGEGGADVDQQIGQAYVPAPAERPAEAQERPEPEEVAPVEGDEPDPGQETPQEAAPPAAVGQAESLPTETTEPSETKAKRYAIQVGLFEAAEGAQQVADDLTRAGYPARVEQAGSDTGTIYRVVTGRYRTEYAARKAMDQLRQEGFPGFLVER